MTFRIHRNWWGWFVVVVVLFNNDLWEPILQREGEGAKQWQTEIHSLEVLHWKAAVVANILFQESRFRARLTFIRVKPQLRREQGWDRELTASFLLSSTNTCIYPSVQSSQRPKRIFLLLLPELFTSALLPAAPQLFLELPKLVLCSHTWSKDGGSALQLQQGMHLELPVFYSQGAEAIWKAPRPKVVF